MASEGKGEEKRGLRDPAHLSAMVDALASIERAIQGRSEVAFLADEMLRAAVERWLTIVGEGAKKLSLDVQARHPDVKWREIERFRDKLSHHYWKIDPRVVWESIVLEAPAMRASLLEDLLLK